MLVQFIVLELLKSRYLYDSTQCISQSLQLRLRLSILCSRMVHHCTLKLYHPVLSHQQPFNYIYFALILAINSISAISDDSEIVVSSTVIYVIFCFIIWLCLTRTGNYQIHEFDWLKRLLTAV